MQQYNNIALCGSVHLLTTKVFLQQYKAINKAKVVPVDPNARHTKKKVMLGAYYGNTPFGSKLSLSPLRTLSLPNQRLSGPAVATVARTRSSPVALRSATPESRWNPFCWCFASWVDMEAMHTVSCIME